MHSIQLNISDTVYNKVMFFLNSIPKKNIEIITTSKEIQCLKSDDENNKHLIHSSVNTIKDWQDESEDEIWK